MTQLLPELVVEICRGCCCGTVRKHPDVDHDAHFREIERAVRQRGRALVRRTGCLGACDLSNLVVVRPKGRSHDSPDAMWFGRILTDNDVRSLSRWIVRLTELEDRSVPHELEGHLYAHQVSLLEITQQG